MASAFPNMESDIEPQIVFSEVEQKQKSTADPYLLSTTTGGVENSCHSCMLAFGLVTILIGFSTTCLALVMDAYNSVFSVLGFSTLFMGIAAVAFSFIWKFYRRKRKQKISEERAELFYEQQMKKYKI